MALAARVSNMPRVRVAAVITLNGNVVLVRHRAGAHAYHLLPGGGVDYGETLQEALLREILEETGLVAAIGRPLIINDTVSPDGRRHLVNITFSATVIGGAVTDEPLDDRVEAVEVVDPSLLGTYDLRPPLASEIQTYLDDEGGYRTTYLGSIYTQE